MSAGAAGMSARAAGMCAAVQNGKPAHLPAIGGNRLGKSFAGGEVGHHPPCLLVHGVATGPDIEFGEGEMMRVGKL